MRINNISFLDFNKINEAVLDCRIKATKVSRVISTFGVTVSSFIGILILLYINLTRNYQLLDSRSVVWKHLSLILAIIIVSLIIKTDYTLVPYTFKKIRSKIFKGDVSKLNSYINLAMAIDSKRKEGYEYFFEYNGKSLDYHEGAKTLFSLPIKQVIKTDNPSSYEILSSTLFINVE